MRSAGIDTIEDGPAVRLIQGNSSRTRPVFPVRTRSPVAKRPPSDAARHWPEASDDSTDSDRYANRATGTPAAAACDWARTSASAGDHGSSAPPSSKPQSAHSAASAGTGLPQAGHGASLPS